jgi:branched-chain amino acid transport system ATP-binding protein
LLSCDHVTASYGRIRACRDATFDVGHGEVLALLGPNGAGKSSLAKALCGFVRSTGSIAWDGTEISQASPAQRAQNGIAYVPEGRGLFGPMSVRENIDMARRLGKDEFAERRELAMELFPRLAERLDQKASMLSGGEQQMLAIGRAICTAPQLLILDEPTQGLAPAVLILVARALKRLQESGMSILLIEQNHAFAAGLADRFVLMQGGAITAGGNSDEMADREAFRTQYLSGTTTHPKGQS